MQTAARKFVASRFVSGGDAAEVLEPAEHALNGVAVPVEVRREAVLPLPVCLRRDVGESAALFDLIFGVTFVVFMSIIIR